jgi:hypothetical protein
MWRLGEVHLEAVLWHSPTMSIDLDGPPVDLDCRNASAVRADDGSLHRSGRLEAARYLGNVEGAVFSLRRNGC